MNQGEGRDLERQLSSLGHVPAASYEEAEVVVVNTCTVIKPTELKIMKRMRVVVQDGKSLVIAGCMASVQREEVSSEFPEAMIIAPKEYGDFAPRFEAKFGRGPGHFSLDLSPITAIIPIAQGCLGSCTYCITKKARGTLESYPQERLVEEAQIHVSNGARELLVTAQDTGCYGLDIGTNLGGLLSHLVQIEGDFKIRVGMMNPDSLAMVIDDLIPAWSNPKVYKFLHLPVQTGSDRMLAAMGRSYSVADFERQAASFRAAFPDMSLSTDIITGFPGETDEDHLSSMELIERIRPSIVNVTRYSPRPGTPAARSKNQVPGWIAKERSTEIAALRFQISSGVYSKYVGREMEISITEKGKGQTMIGRNGSYIPVVVSGDVAVGDKVLVKVISAAPTHLAASIVRRVDDD
jgi:MiaB-like tRNA modifying enzyme